MKSFLQFVIHVRNLRGKISIENSELRLKR
jgi:hypothetical protein